MLNQHVGRFLQGDDKPSCWQGGFEDNQQAAVLFFERAPYSVTLTAREFFAANAGHWGVMEHIRDVLAQFTKRLPDGGGYLGDRKA